MNDINTDFTNLAKMVSRQDHLHTLTFSCAFKPKNMNDKCCALPADFLFFTQAKHCENCMGPSFHKFKV